MKSIVKGQIVKETYSVVDNLTTITVDGEEKQVFVAKPRIDKQTEIAEWRNILTLDGAMHYNTPPADGWLGVVHRCFNISEDETVCEIKKIFRADLNENHYFTDKAVETRTVNKEESELRLRILMAGFNEQMTESNEQMSAYCKLHKLDPRDTDCEELFKIVYPNKEYEIVDGKMKEKVNCHTISSQALTMNTSPVTLYATSRGGF